MSSSASRNSSRPNNAPSASSRQASSNSFKFIVAGALFLMTGASYLVAVTSSFQSVPDIVAPPRDESKHNNDRGLHEEKPWNIKPEKKSLSWGVEVKEAADDKVLEAVGEESGKKEAAQQEMKQANERLKNETKTAAETDEKESQKPEQDDVKGDEQQKPEDSQKKKKPLNILLLYGDDWRHDSIGAASGGLVKTPFLDNLGYTGCSIHPQLCYNVRLLGKPCNIVHWTVCFSS